LEELSNYQRGIVPRTKADCHWHIMEKPDKALGGQEPVDLAKRKPFDDIFIAVHGIGEQSRFSTVRSVATRLAGSPTLLGNGTVHPVAEQPLGYFHSDVATLTSVRPLDDVKGLSPGLASIGFAEVFWADIPQQVEHEGSTLEETKAWARTVVARARAHAEAAKCDEDRKWIDLPDFTLAGEVLEEIIETVYVLENVTFLAEKAGLFKFDLKRILAEYLGDVQIVAEFGYYRTDIVGRFHRAMESIHSQYPLARLHIVAHSEGTVVSFLGLLHAMSQNRLLPADSPAKAGLDDKWKGFPEWLKQVRGYMTIGSPIDKHLLLWPRMWEGLKPQLANNLFKDTPICWRNYYDYGDPVGFKLDSARLWLSKKVECTAFQFCGCSKCHHDIGFARYVFPGQAHNEYWNDCDVFEHFIKDVVHPEPGSRPTPPQDKQLVKWLSPLLPYLVSFVVLLVGVFVLYKAVHAYTHPGSDALQRFVRYRELGITPQPEQSAGDLGLAVFGITALIAGTTLLSRFPRLAFGSCLPARWRQGAKTKMPGLSKNSPRVTWKLAGVVAFLLGCLLYLVVPGNIRAEIGDRFYSLGWLGDWAPTVAVLALAALGGVSGYLVTTRSKSGPARRQRWLGKGARPLLLCGVVIIGGIIFLQVRPPEPGRPNFTPEEVKLLTPELVAAIKETRLTRDELNQIIVIQGTNWADTLQKVQPALTTHPSIWPVVLAGTAFLYLWWLATLLFDLGFVWQRYVRRSVVNDRLLQWNPYRLPTGPDDEPSKTASCRCES
jgi:hypothetical protein